MWITHYPPRFPFCSVLGGYRSSCREFPTLRRFPFSLVLITVRALRPWLVFFFVRPDTFSAARAFFFVRLLLSLFPVQLAQRWRWGKKAGSSSYNFLALVYALCLRVALECPSGNRDKNSSELLPEIFGKLLLFLHFSNTKSFIDWNWCRKWQIWFWRLLGSHELDGGPGRHPISFRSENEGQTSGAAEENAGVRATCTCLRHHPTEIRTLRSSVPVEMARHRTPSRRLHRYALCNIHETSFFHSVNAVFGRNVKW